MRGAIVGPRDGAAVARRLRPQKIQQSHLLQDRLRRMMAFSGDKLVCGPQLGLQVAAQFTAALHDPPVDLNSLTLERSQRNRDVLVRL
jgi:hypothetical protein